MKSMRTVMFLFVFLLALGAFAVQNPAGDPSGQMGHSQAQPGQMSPSQSTQPAQSQTPDARSAEPSQQSPQMQGRQMPSIDDQVKILAEQLELTNDQQIKTKGILEEQHSQAMNIVGDSSTPRDEKVQKIHALRENTISKVRTMLNDDQKKKFDVMVERQNERMRQREEQSGSNGTPPSNTSPGSSSSPASGNNAPPSGTNTPPPSGSSNPPPVGNSNPPASKPPM